MDLLEKIKADAKKHNVELFLPNTDKVLYMGIECNGYFIDRIPKLAVACGKDESIWKPILIHEYCHMKQWIENDLAWTNNKISDSIEAVDLLDLWINNQIELSEKQLKDYIERAIIVEHDCEQRVLNMNRELSLGLNEKEHTQKSLSYILFYHLIKRHRIWYKSDKTPYELPEVYKKMPTDINYDVLNPEESLLKILEKHCL